MRCLALLVGVAALGLLTAGPASAQTTLTGGSTLLSQADADQLGTWLGQGSVTLTRLFRKSEGGTFHDAVDGKGATFTVMQSYATGGGNLQLIGGYNPVSWDSTTGPRLTPNPSDRTAFLFNLTSSVKQAQETGTADGATQTYNDGAFGPTWGAGFDLFTDSTLSTGFALPLSYDGGTGNNIRGNSFESFGVGEVEVFSVTLSTPEPGALMLMVPGLAVVPLVRRRKKA